MTGCSPAPRRTARSRSCTRARREDVATALRICSAHRHPVVPQGGLTGLAGGATPVQRARRRLARPHARDRGGRRRRGDHDRAGRAFRCSACRRRRSRRACCSRSISAARGSCLIGGNVSTNAGGNRVLRYGMTRALVLGRGGGAGGRHRALVAQQDAEEQCGLRPEAALHRQRGHARHRHAPGAAPVPAAAQHLHRALRPAGLRRGAATCSQRGASPSSGRRSRPSR